MGDRIKKYQYLDNNNINTIPWKKINPSQDYYLLKEIDEKEATFYYAYPKLDEIFILNNSGMYTARDQLTIKWSKEVFIIPLVTLLD